MIQRIQSVFLVLAVIANSLMFFFPLASFFNEFNYYKLYLYEFRNLTPDTTSAFSNLAVLPLELLNFGIIILAIVTLLQYKNRVLQIKMNNFNILLTVFLLAGMFFIYPQLAETKIAATTTFETGTYFPIVTLACLLLANRFISKDEKLVRSTDRLR
jgi:hypothetical protein